MDQAISGVSPASVKETTVMTVWPSNAMYAAGRLLGRAYAIDFPGIYIFRLGNLLALLSIPVALVLFFMRIAPWIGQRYTITNRRVVVYKGLLIEEERSVALDRFDAIDVVVQPGQAWYEAGDLVFRLGNTETFRLPGVSRPESFRAACLKARMAYVGVKKAVSRQLAHA
jgi:membrane protein YdbS with pleckstrin-like domain